LPSGSNRVLGKRTENLSTSLSLPDDEIRIQLSKRFDFIILYYYYYYYYYYY
jgi:hypothetical protein